MVPWNMLSKDLQKAILAIVVLYGGARTCTCPPIPVICDPPPPPATKTPMICDPPPPPHTAVPMLTKTPMICDPPPPPRTTTPTVPGLRYFQVRSLQTTSDPSVSGARVKGRVVNQQNQPLGGLQVTAQGKSRIQVVTGSTGDFVLFLPEPGSYQLMVEDDQAHSVQLKLEQHDVVTIEWVEIKQTGQGSLPLAEIRTVDLLWGEGLTFRARTPWPDARYRWSVSGGKLIETDEGVIWQPPAEPGRYLLQVVADWGPEGLAVDSMTLIVERDGSVMRG